MLEKNSSKDYIMCSHITGIYDVNRNTTLKDDDYSLVSVWADSVSALKIKGIIFHNNFSEATIKAYENEYVKFIKIDYNNTYNPNVFRYSIYNNYLKENHQEISNVFFTDVSDVVVLQNPFISKFYIDHSTSIFSGDEPEILENEWMLAHGEHFRNKIHDYSKFELGFTNETLLNCGVFGGNIETMATFVNELWSIHQTYNHDNRTAYTGDMGAFNYLVRTKYNDSIIHGKPVNTVFKKYEADKECWFMHK
jgi:hypothetical protein